MHKGLTLKILTIVGARPQFIKASAVSRLICSNKYRKIDEVIVHTGQHYDYNMSQSFFNELGIPVPKYNLEVGSGTHGQQTGVIMSELEKVVNLENPDWVLVYGDTNSTLAAALVAAKRPCKLAHVEAGLRSYRAGMPEEVNRVVTDRLSDLLFCPTILAQKNLEDEGCNQNAILTGDVMYDNFLHYNGAADHAEVIHRYGLLSDQYILVTIHRAENTDNKENLSNILAALRLISKEIEVILPLHPRTKKMIEEFSLSLKGIKVVNPIPYLSMISLLGSAKAVVTDSGGLQKEAYFSKTPCLTIRDETEWIETLEKGWNRLVSPHDLSEIIDKLNKVLGLDCSSMQYNHHYGLGDSSEIIINTIANSV